MKCKNCGMKYDGPPEKFPESGLCPMCAMPPNVRAEAIRQDAEDEQRERERKEANREAWVGVW